MSFFKWNERYAFGFESIDSDHKVLVSLIDDLYSALSKGEGKNVIQGIVAKLVDYTKVHFKREEFYMQSINYTDTAQHIAQHEFFIQKVDSFMEKLDAGVSNISIEVITFLRDWLINHILNTDKKFVTELMKSEIK